MMGQPNPCFQFHDVDMCVCDCIFIKVCTRKSRVAFTFLLHSWVNQTTSTLYAKVGASWLARGDRKKFMRYNGCGRKRPQEPQGKKYWKDVNTSRKILNLVSVLFLSKYFPYSTLPKTFQPIDVLQHRARLACSCSLNLKCINNQLRLILRVARAHEPQKFMSKFPSCAKEATVSEAKIFFYSVRKNIFMRFTWKAKFCWQFEYTFESYFKNMLML